MDDAVVPAVIVSNLPPHLSKSTDASCLALLGSKTGEEVGVLFWRVHPSLAKFMVAFKNQEDRDHWHKSSPSLKKATSEFGMKTSMIWYNREAGLVMKKLPTNNTTAASMTPFQLQGEAKSNSRMIFQDEFEDLDNIFGVVSAKVEDREEDRDADKISPAEANDEVTEEPDKLKEVEENQDDVASPSKGKTSNLLGGKVDSELPEFLPMELFLNMTKLSAGKILIPLTITQLQEALEFQPDCYDEDLDEEKMKVRS